MNKIMFPHPSRLKSEISLPPKAAPLMAKWLGIPPRTIYDWINGSIPSSTNLNRHYEKLGLRKEDFGEVSIARMMLYTAWYNATQEPSTYVKSNAWEELL